MVTGRFAPTPSGRMHLGNAFTALLAWLSAKKQGGRVLLRIEDLDRDRCPKDGVKWLLDDLDWLGLDFDGDVVYQSERTAAYERALAVLREKGLIYPCFCSRAELHAATAPHGSTPVYGGKCRGLDPAAYPNRPPALRVAVPDETVRFCDGVFGDCAEDLATQCGDFIVRRSDGVFAYQLAVTVDDAESGVTEVVRGADLLSSSPRQIFLYRMLGYEPPRFFHVPLLVDENGERLSKRNGSANLGQLRARLGDPTPAVGLLACAAGLLDRPEPVAAADLVARFSWDGVPKTSVRVDADAMRVVR